MMFKNCRLRLPHLACLVGTFAVFHPLRATALDVDEVFPKWQPKQLAVRTEDDDEDHSWCGTERADLGETAYWKMRIAKNLTESSHFDEAINEYTDLIALSYYKYDYLKARSLAYERVGKLDAALADLKAAKCSLGDLDLLRVLFKLGLYQAAIDEIDKSFEGVPANHPWIQPSRAGDPDLLFLRGCAEGELAKPEQAAADYKNAATKYMMKGDADSAKHCEERTAALKHLADSSKFSVDGLNFRRLDYDISSHQPPSRTSEFYDAKKQVLSAEQFDAAIESRNQKIKKHPGDLKAYHDLYVLYLGKNDLPMALKSINTCIELEPERSFYTYAERAYVYEKQQLFDKAIEDLSIFIDADRGPNSVNFAHVYSMRADLQCKKKVYKKAVADYDESIKAEPLGETFEKKAQVEYEMGDAKAARDDMQQAIQHFYSEARIVRRDAALHELARMDKGEPYPSIHPIDEL